MRRSLAKFSELEASNHTPSSADFTTTTPELKFSVHTPLPVGVCCGSIASLWLCAGYFRFAPNAVIPVSLRIVLFEACPAFTRVTACTLALSPIRDTLTEGFSHFVSSMTAPVASGWSGCRVGLAPTGRRRLFTAHTQTGPFIFDFWLDWQSPCKRHVSPSVRLYAFLRGNVSSALACRERAFRSMQSKYPAVFV